MNEFNTMSARRVKREIRSRVERGAALLDRRQPRWFEKIDLAAFELSSGAYCICGQLDAVKLGREPSQGGDWESALYRLFGRRIDRFKNQSRDETHGFSVPYQLDSALYKKAGVTGWEYAEGIWKTEIKRRRKTAKTAAREPIAA